MTAQSRTVLICGAAGFIGQHAASTFTATGWKVFGAGRPPAPFGKLPADRYFQGDLGDRAFAAAVLERCAPDRVLFLAGPSSVQQSFADPFADFQRQMMPLLGVLDGIRRHAASAGVVLLSSASVYGEPRAVPVAEQAPCRPISPYGFHKLQQEMLLAEYSSLYGLSTSIARVFSTFGEGLRQLAVWDITRRALQGDFSVHGTGRETRDYLHVSDVAGALQQICRRAPFAGEVINVASGTETSMLHMSNSIYRLLGITASPAFDESAEQGKPVRWCADVQYLQALGFTQELTLIRGLERTIRWIREHA